MTDGLPDLRSNGFGVLGVVQSFGDLGAALVAGILWSVSSPPSHSFTPQHGWLFRSPPQDG